MGQHPPVPESGPGGVLCKNLVFLGPFFPAVVPSTWNWQKTLLCVPLRGFLLGFQGSVPAAYMLALISISCFLRVDRFAVSSACFSACQAWPQACVQELHLSNSPVSSWSLELAGARVAQLQCVCMPLRIHPHLDLRLLKSWAPQLCRSCPSFIIICTVHLLWLFPEDFLDCHKLFSVNAKLKLFHADLTWFLKIYFLI